MTCLYPFCCHVIKVKIKDPKPTRGNIIKPVVEEQKNLLLVYVFVNLEYPNQRVLIFIITYVNTKDDLSVIMTVLLLFGGIVLSWHL